MHAWSENEAVARGDGAYSSIRKTLRLADSPSIVKDGPDKDRDPGRKKQETIQSIQASDLAAIRIGCVFVVGNARRGNPA
jgi:hypothetical protein